MDQYLRDAYTCEDYMIVDSALLKMIPVSSEQIGIMDEISKASQSLSDMNDFDDTVIGTPQHLPAGNSDDGVQEALDKENLVFSTRERWLSYLNTCISMLLFVSLMGFISAFWYVGVAGLLAYLLADHFRPKYTRFTGFLGKQSDYRFGYCTSMVVVSLGAFILSFGCSLKKVLHLSSSSSSNSGFCSFDGIYTLVYFFFCILLMVSIFVINSKLLNNFKLQPGELIERLLVQNRNVKILMEAANKGNKKSQRIAAFEIATMASTSDDNKFIIVAEGGLQTLINMMLTRDNETQEHAVDAVRELISVPAIQKNFIVQGGVKTLCALLHTESSVLGDRVVHMVAVTLNYLILDDEKNKNVVIEGHGLDDLCHAASVPKASHVISEILHELAFDSKLRKQMVKCKKLGGALLSLIEQRGETEATRKLALQTLELLSIDNPAFVCNVSNLLSVLLDMPNLTDDITLYSLAAKLLYLLGQDEVISDSMRCNGQVATTMWRFARCRDAAISKVVAATLTSLLTSTGDLPPFTGNDENEDTSVEFTKIMNYIKDHTNDRSLFETIEKTLKSISDEE